MPGRVCRRRAISSLTLCAGQLAALAGLRALRDLDLELVGRDGVARGDAEARRGDLLDARVALVAEALGILAAFARVRAGAEPVERDRHRLVRLGRERAVRHAAAREAAQDRLGRLDLVERHRLGRGNELEQVAQLERLALVDELRRTARSRPSPCRSPPRGACEPRPRCSAATTSGFDRVRARRPCGTSRTRGSRAPASPTRAASCRARHVALELREADRRRRSPGVCGKHAPRRRAASPIASNTCGAAVRVDVGDAHLRHHLEDAVLDRAAEASLRFVRGGGRRRACPPPPGRRRSRARGAGTRRRRRSRAGRRSGAPRAARRSRRRATSRCAGPASTRARWTAATARSAGSGSAPRRSPHRRAAGRPRRRAHRRDGVGGEPAASGREALVARTSRRDRSGGATAKRRRVEEEALELEELAPLGAFREQRRACAEQRLQRHHAALAQVVDRRVRHLREALAEERVERPRAPGERRQRGVVAHRRDRLVAV